MTAAQKAAETRARNAETRKRKEAEERQVVEAVTTVCMDVIESEVMLLDSKFEAVKILYDLLRGR